MANVSPTNLNLEQIRQIAAQFQIDPSLAEAFYDTADGTRETISKDQAIGIVRSRFKNLVELDDDNFNDPRGWHEVIVEIQLESGQKPDGNMPTNLKELKEREEKFYQEYRAKQFRAGEARLLARIMARSGGETAEEESKTALGERASLPPTKEVAEEKTEEAESFTGKFRSEATEKILQEIQARAEAREIRPQEDIGKYLTDVLGPAFELGFKGVGEGTVQEEEVASTQTDASEEDETHHYEAAMLAGLSPEAREQMESILLNRRRLGKAAELLMKLDKSEKIGKQDMADKRFAERLVNLSPEDRKKVLERILIGQTRLEKAAELLRKESGLKRIDRGELSKKTESPAVKAVPQTTPQSQIKKKGIITALAGGIGVLRGASQSREVKDFLAGALSSSLIQTKRFFQWLADGGVASWAAVAGGVAGTFMVSPVVGTALGAGVGWSVAQSLKDGYGQPTPSTGTLVSSSGPAGGSGVGGIINNLSSRLGGRRSEPEKFLGAGLKMGAQAVTSGVGASTIAFFGVIVSLIVLTGATVLFVINYQTAFAQPEQQGQQAENDPTINQGKLFTVRKTAQKGTFVNDSNADVVYSVTITASQDSDLSNISVVDTMTRENSKGTTAINPATTPTFPSTLAKGQGSSVEYRYKLTAADNNSNLVNVVVVTAEGNSQTETLTAQAYVTVGTADYTASRCPVATTGPCASSEMAKYFPVGQADNASRICLKESGGDINNINNACIKNLAPKDMREYSVGLFQVNLWAHDGRDDPNGLCKRVLGGQTPFNKPFYAIGRASCQYPDCSPCDRNEDLLKSCKDYWIQPGNNIQYAAQLFKDVKSKWYPTWSTAGPRYCNIP